MNRDFDRRVQDGGSKHVTSGHELAASAPLSEVEGRIETPAPTKDLTLRARVIALLRNPLSESEYIEQAQRTSSPVGLESRFIEVASEDEYRQLFEVIREFCPDLTPDWIEETIKHEIEHGNEARRTVGQAEGFRCFYGVCFIACSGGTIGVGPFCSVYTDAAIPPEALDQIRNAPESLSSSDQLNFDQIWEELRAPVIRGAVSRSNNETD